MITAFWRKLTYTSRLIDGVTTLNCVGYFKGYCDGYFKGILPSFFSL